MKKIVVDMQNFLFADSIATAFKNSDYDIAVVRAESPAKIPIELCRVFKTVCPFNGGYRLYSVAALREDEAAG